MRISPTHSRRDAEREQRAEIIPVARLAEEAAEMHRADILRRVKLLRREIEREEERAGALALRPAAGIDDGSGAQRGGILQLHALRRSEKGGRRHRRGALTARGKVLRAPNKIVRFHSCDYITPVLRLQCKKTAECFPRSFVLLKCLAWVCLRRSQTRFV